MAEYYNLDQYVTDAMRTCSPENEYVETDPMLLAGVIQILIAAGNMLDQIKKRVFYGKDYEPDDLSNEFMNVVRSLDQIKPSIQDLKQAEIKMMPDPNVGIVPVDQQVFHSVVGITTEATELLEALITGLEGNEIDYVNILEEFGDLSWYTAIGLNALGGDWGQILDTNIEKLRARYPEKFTSELAINRDTETEHHILKKNVEK